jgi:hypothetical protein
LTLNIISQGWTAECGAAFYGSRVFPVAALLALSARGRLFLFCLGALCEYRLNQSSAQVFAVNGAGEDVGVVFSEMQGCERQMRTLANLKGDAADMGCP